MVMRKYLLLTVLACFVIFSFIGCVQNPEKNQLFSFDGLTVSRQGADWLGVVTGGRSVYEIVFVGEDVALQLVENAVSFTRSQDGKTTLVLGRANSNFEKGEVLFTLSAEKYPELRILSVTAPVQQEARIETRAGEALLGDFNGDGTVSLPDFGLFIPKYGKSTGDVGYDAGYDIAPATKGTGDWADIYCYATPNGIINILDFQIFIGNYGKTSPVTGKSELIGLTFVSGNQVQVELDTVPGVALGVSDFTLQVNSVGKSFTVTGSGVYYTLTMSSGSFANGNVVKVIGKNNVTGTVQGTYGPTTVTGVFEYAEVSIAGLLSEERDPLTALSQMNQSGLTPRALGTATIGGITYEVADLNTLGWMVGKSILGGNPLGGRTITVQLNPLGKIINVLEIYIPDGFLVEKFQGLLDAVAGGAINAFTLQNVNVIGESEPSELIGGRVDVWAISNFGWSFDNIQFPAVIWMEGTHTFENCGFQGAVTIDGKPMIKDSHFVAAINGASVGDEGTFDNVTSDLPLVFPAAMHDLTFRNCTFDQLLTVHGEDPSFSDNVFEKGIKANADPSKPTFDGDTIDGKVIVSPGTRFEGILFGDNVDFNPAELEGDDNKKLRFADCVFEGQMVFNLDGYWFTNNCVFEDDFTLDALGTNAVIEGVQFEAHVTINALVSIGNASFIAPSAGQLVALTAETTFEDCSFTGNGDTTIQTNSFLTFKGTIDGKPTAVGARGIPTTEVNSTLAAADPVLYAHGVQISDFLINTAAAVKVDFLQTAGVPTNNARFMNVIFNDATDRPRDVDGDGNRFEDCVIADDGNFTLDGPGNTFSGFEMGNGNLVLNGDENEITELIVGGNLTITGQDNEVGIHEVGGNVTVNGAGYTTADPMNLLLQGNSGDIVGDLDVTGAAGENLNIQIVDVTVKGDLVLATAHYVIYENCVFEQGATPPLGLDADADDSEFSDCEFTSAVNLVDGSDALSFTDCVFGDDLTVGDIANSSFTGNSFYGNIVINDANALTFTNSTFTPDAIQKVNMVSPGNECLFNGTTTISVHTVTKNIAFDPSTNVPPQNSGTIRFKGTIHYKNQVNFVAPITDPNIGRCVAKTSEAVFNLNGVPTWPDNVIPQ